MFFYSELEEIVQQIYTSWLETGKITASDKDVSDEFGRSVCVSNDGSTIVVGAYLEDPDNLTSAGSVYVFTKSGGTWVESQKLTASDKTASDFFGFSVSVSSDGSIIVVGAYGEDPDGVSSAGSVYVFTNSGGTWVESQKLTASDKAVSDQFGRSVSVSSDGSTIVVGAAYEDPDGIDRAGSAYVFTKSGGTWVESQKLTASDKAVLDYFGISVSVSGDGSTIVVGAYGEDPDGISLAGSAYVFAKSGGTWVESQKLTASDKADSDYFGWSVSVSSDGSTIVIGAYGKDANGMSNVGSAYVFTKSGGTWVESQKLTASDKAASDWFGRSVSVSSDGSIIVVGAPEEDPDEISTAGSTYVFTKSAGTWTETQKLTTSDKQVDDYSATSVSVSGDGSVIVVTAYGEDPDGIDRAGSVYVFEGQ